MKKTPNCNKPLHSCLYLSHTGIYWISLKHLVKLRILNLGSENRSKIGHLYQQKTHTVICVGSVVLCSKCVNYNDYIDNSGDGDDSDSIKYESDDDNNDDGNGFSEGSVIHLAYQILEGLAFLHSKGVTHRSLSLDNILLQTQVSPLSIIYICFSFLLTLLIQVVVHYR